MRTALLMLAFATAALADPPKNNFEPNELSSDSVVASVLTCQKRALDADPRVDKLQVTRFCACLADAMRAEYKRTRKVGEPSARNVATCESRFPFVVASEAERQKAAQAQVDQAVASAAPTDPMRGRVKKADGSWVTQLLDVQMQAVVEVPDANVTKLVASGRYTLLKGTVAVVDNLNTPGFISAEQATEAFSQGYRYRTSVELEAEREREECDKSWLCSMKPK